jgi:hypothetical protein
MSDRKPGPLEGPDLDRYRHHLAHLDMPEKQKDETILAVWRIMRSFVDRAFGDDAAQLARKGGDGLAIDREGESAAVLPSTNHNTQGDEALSRAFTKRANRGARKEKP